MSVPHNPPAVTIVIPTIPGREHLLARAEKSARAQDYPSASLVVMVENDFFRTGAAATRNRALNKVQTPWIAWLDDDDELMPGHVRTLINAAYRRDDVPHAESHGSWGTLLTDVDTRAADLVYPIPEMEPRHARDPTAVMHNGVMQKPWGLPFTPASAEHIRKRGSFIPMTHLVWADTAYEIGGFPDGVTLSNGRYSGEDEQYLIRMLKAGAVFKHEPSVTWIWHVHSEHTAGKGTS